jgi:hypothetical protein
MSKQNIKKFKKNYFDDEDDYDRKETKNKIDKRKARRAERALKTKDVSILMDDDDEIVDSYLQYYRL